MKTIISEVNCQKETSNKLASIQIIKNIKPIEGADRIEMACIKEWECVIAKKDNFQVGDFVVYVEINGLMPEKPEYEFLRPRKFRVRTIKLRSTLSQGLILPLSVIPQSIPASSIRRGAQINVLKEGDDVGEILGITKYDPEGQEEKKLNIKKPQNKVMKFLMDYRLFRTIYLSLNKKNKGSFPTHVISKSDEENIQNCANVIINNFDKSFYITEKVEGQSATFYTSFEKRWGFKRKIFAVCSRNLRLGKPDNSKYWESARKYDLENVLKKYKGIAAVQSEQTGVGIQGNIYKLEGVELFVFNVKLNGERLGYSDMFDFCVKHNLKTVPLIDPIFVPSKKISSNDKATVVKWLLDYSNGKSLLFNTLREGIVMRLNENPNISFKVKSPDYLIEHGE